MDDLDDFMSQVYQADISRPDQFDDVVDFVA